MAARTTMPNGSIRQWHTDTTECSDRECAERHLTVEELFRADADDERAFWFAYGKNRP